MWGIPRCFRVDNGVPWGNPGDLPSALALWLIGFGVLMNWNHARRPHENGKIERFNGLLDQWGEPQQCTSLRSWKVKLKWVEHMQRDCYPSMQGISRAQAFPELFVPQHPYTIATESALWDIQRIKDFLAQQIWSRKVDACGNISIYHRSYRVGKSHAHQMLALHFDAATCEWWVADRHGHEVRRWNAGQITVEYIRTLSVGNIRPSVLNAKRAA
jgi:transposase InsO family protein